MLGNHENISLGRGHRFCEVANLDQWYAVVILTEDQIKFAQLDQPAWIKLYTQPDKTIESVVEATVETDLSIDRKDFDAPATGQADHNVSPTRPPDLIMEMVSALQKQELQYYARVPLPDSELPLKIGLGGQARLFTGYRSLGSRLLWWFNQNFGR